MVRFQHSRNGGLHFWSLSAFGFRLGGSIYLVRDHAKRPVQRARSADFELALRIARNDMDYVAAYVGRVDSGRDDSRNVVVPSK